MKNYEEQIKELLANPDLMIQKKPFTRGGRLNEDYNHTVGITDTLEAKVPNYSKTTISQGKYLNELDPTCHEVLYDNSVPSICVQIEGNYYEVKYKKLAVPYQENILDKKILHSFGNKTQFSLLLNKPTDKQKTNYTIYKQYWEDRNQDGMRNDFARKQKSVGDAGWLFYFDYKGRVKSRTLSYIDGYTICPQNDANGDRIMDCIYYNDGEQDKITAYDDKYMYTFLRDKMIEKNSSESGWRLVDTVVHGFDESPLITKRGDVAWEGAQPIIETYEILYNVFNVIQRKFGNGILYIKGSFKEQAMVAGNYVLNDTNNNPDVNSDAKYLTPPSPSGMLETLDRLREEIQIASKTTWILPKDIKMSGDISAIAIKLTQSLDYEEALSIVQDYQNVANKATRLFKSGLAKELANNGINELAVTEFDELLIKTFYKPWMPTSEMDLVYMLNSAKQGGFVSKLSCVEQSPFSSPDEMDRINAETEESMQLELKKIDLTKQQEAELTPIVTESSKTTITE